MTESQSALTEFEEGSQTTSSKSPEPNIEPVSIPANSCFTIPDEEYPKRVIAQLTDESTIRLSLCVPNGTVSTTFTHLAGEGGMGPGSQVNNPREVKGLLSSLNKIPILVTGGGMNTPMGGGFLLGRLVESKLTGNTVEINYKELYRHSKPSREARNTKRLGAYQLFVPQTQDDLESAVKALTHWENGETEYLNPEKREANRAKEQHQAAFESLSPGDKVETPEYATRLDVISEPFNTHAIIPRGTLKDKSVEVIAVTVENPRGGFYQLGMSPTASSRYQSGPTCYMSRSTKTPPTPNTAFTRDASFSCDDIEIITIDHPPDPTVIEPNKEVLQSPLPEPRLQTSLEELSGIGEKTSRKINRVSDTRVTAESLAWALFGEGTNHTDSQREIKGILDSLPKHEQIYDQLSKYAPDIE